MFEQTVHVLDQAALSPLLVSEQPPWAAIAGVQSGSGHSLRSSPPRSCSLMVAPLSRHLRQVILSKKMFNTAKRKDI